MKAINRVFNLSVLICTLFLNLQFANAQSGVSNSEVISASVSCDALGELNGEIGYKYEVTLQNNTNEKFLVDYTVIFKSGSVVKKSHNHSTILIAGESLTESHTAKMSVSDWDTISECRIEWSTRN